LKEFMKDGNFELRYTPGTINLSDITTKNCGVHIFTRLKEQIYSKKPHHLVERYFKSILMFKYKGMFGIYKHRVIEKSELYLKNV